MIHVHLDDDGPIPDLDDSVAQQKEYGGRLVMYHRVWSAILISQTQHRIEWVPPSGSRVLPGLKHCLYSLVLGIWGVTLISQVPLCLIMNLRGGIDVTAQFSDRNPDSFHTEPPDPDQAKRDERNAQWIFVALGLIVIATILFLTLGKA